MAAAPLVSDSQGNNICSLGLQSKSYQLLPELLFIILPVVISSALCRCYFDNNYGPWCWDRSVEGQCRRVVVRDQMSYRPYAAHWTPVFSIVHHKLANTVKDAKGLFKQTLRFQLGYVGPHSHTLTGCQTVHQISSLENLLLSAETRLR